MVEVKHPSEVTIGKTHFARFFAGCSDAGEPVPAIQRLVEHYQGSIRSDGELNIKIHFQVWHVHKQCGSQKNGNKYN